LSILGVVLCVLVVAEAGDRAWGAGEADLKHLMEIIKKQQEQIEAQSRALEELRQKVETLSRETQETKAAAEKVADLDEAGAFDRVVTSASDKVKVDLYGQVNRAVLYSDDGNDENFYFVDNDNSSTRVGLAAKARLNDDLTAGGRIEVEFQSNDSDLVNQFEKSGVGDNNFRKRWLDFSIESKRFGTLFIGHGGTASEDTSETDLSGTGVVANSEIGDMAGGQIFYNNDTDSYDLTGGDPSTGTAVADVFNNLDGLGRNDRIRYDTPVFYGFRASTSAVADDAYDVSLWYAAEFAGTKLAASASYAKPNDLRPTTDNQYSGSVSALHRSGFNLTFAGGLRNYEDPGAGLPDRDDGRFWWGKLGYRQGFFPIGETRLSADYGEHRNMARDDDEARTFGLQFVQVIDSWGTEYYFGYRFHELDREEADVDFENINAVMTGFRIKF
jgi:predicted porin